MKIGLQLNSIIESDVDLQKFERLARDLRRIHVGEGPTDADLSTAPLLNYWGVAPNAACCLFGDVSGHPKIGDNFIATSQLFAINVKNGWARTHSRWYRLGVYRPRP